jgi:hypothetical protein
VDGLRPLLESAAAVRLASCCNCQRSSGVGVRKLDCDWRCVSGVLPVERASACCAGVMPGCGARVAFGLEARGSGLGLTVVVDGGIEPAGRCDTGSEWMGFVATGGCLKDLVVSVVCPGADELARVGSPVLSAALGRGLSGMASGAAWEG